MWMALLFSCHTEGRLYNYLPILGTIWKRNKRIVTKKSCCSLPLKTSINLGELYEEFCIRKPALTLFLNDEFKQTRSVSDQWTFTLVCTINCCGQRVRGANRRFWPCCMRSLFSLCFLLLVLWYSQLYLVRPFIKGFCMRMRSMGMCYWWPLFLICTVLFPGVLNLCFPVIIFFC